MSRIYELKKPLNEEESRSLGFNDRTDKDEREGECEGEGEENNSTDLVFYSFSKNPQQLQEKHRKAVSAIGLDPSGARMFTAGYDHYLKHWDKGIHFREDEEPFGSYPIRTISFSSRGDKALVVPRSPQPAIVTREGRIL